MASPESAEPLIRVTENGPYRVEGSIPVRDAQGNPVEAPARYFLCRCGGSKNKPFCDGTHAKVGFQGEETADHSPIGARSDKYPKDGLTVLDDRTVCSHAGHCTDRLASVFKLRTEPWIDPEGANQEAIVEVIRSCPSGALRYAVGDSPEPVEEERGPQVTPSHDGPYWLSGGITVVSADGEPYERRERQTLCRCGGSKNKPFCDGTHWHIGFKAG
jgi:CDGSH-type Zn-finger protein